MKNLLAAGLLSMASALSCTPTPEKLEQRIFMLDKLPSNSEGFCNETVRSRFRGSDSLASIDVFCALPVGDIVRRLNKASSEQTLTILYPGAGSHLAPLELAHEVAELPDSIAPFVHFIYTEIDPNAPERLVSAMNIMEDQGFYLMRKSEKEFSVGREVSFVFMYAAEFGERAFQVTYALNRSEQNRGDHPYFHQEYAERADIIINHDNDSEHSPLLFTKYFQAAAASPTPKLIIFEDYLRMCDGKLVSYAALPGSVSIIARPYGCVHKPEARIGTEKYSCAIAFIPDKNKLEGKTEEELWAMVESAFGDDLFNWPSMSGSPPKLE